MGVRGKLGECGFTVLGTESLMGAGPGYGCNAMRWDTVARQNSFQFCLIPGESKVVVNMCALTCL